MGRPRTIDLTNLVVIYPDRSYCRCVICDRTLAGYKLSNIKRHYQRLHPEVVLPQPQDTTGPIAKTNNSVTAITGMGRTPLMDARALANVQPDERRCRCRICDKTLIFSSGNVPRHCKNSHPQNLPDRSLRNRPVENRDPTMETDDEDEIASSSRLSNEQIESIFIGKSEVSDVVDVDVSDDDQLIDADEMRFAQSLNQSQPPIAAPLTTNSSPSATVTSTVALAPTTSRSGDDAFFLQYVGNKFGNYSTRTKNTVQFQINRILYRADMGCFEKGESKNLNVSEID
ncbi:uncharacterized protein LOC111081512 [Drosophila obscura]|uniref:uncharacterized protein LOC111081512 n=1 Tax=Drosophila obscura TaxID=7282 RepID=UPI001BB1D506|nr:uncharacterized protein LOC111081512 [Drosophila obscura]